MWKNIFIYDAHNREPGIRNREPGTGSSFLISVNVRDISNVLIGHRKSKTGNLFLVPYFGIYVTNVSKVQIGNKEPVPGSFLTIIGFILVSGFVYFISRYGIK